MKPGFKWDWRVLTLLFCLGLPALADDITQIKALETRYFERSFDKDAESDRLDRLENFIFGATSSGDSAKRLANIESVVSANTPPPESAQPQPQAQKQTGAPAGGGHNGGSSSGDEPDLPGDYPRVSTLETDMLGKTYEADGIRQRLSRLEGKAFGAPASDDLSSRVERLEKWDMDHNTTARKREAARVQAESQYQYLESPYDNQSTASPTSSSQPGSQARPKARSGGDPLMQNPLLAFGAGQPYLPPYNSSYSAPDVAEMNREKSVEQQRTDADRPEPPSPQERTLSRVAWCEKQLFGQTFPQMHLLKRLRQLNDNIFPGDRSSDMQLMDRIDLIVKTVVLRKHPG